MLLQLIRSRRSIRKYKDKPLAEEKIYKIIEGARLAPSGRNTQPWHFIIVKSDVTRGKIAKASYNQKWMLSAPVHIVAVADIGVRIKDSTGIFLDENSPQEELKQIIRDTAIAVEHMVLTAQSLELATCWVAWFAQEDIRPILNIPSDKYVVGILTVGYGDEEVKARPRKSIEEIVHMETWQVSE